MSLPSIKAVASRLGIDPENPTPDQQELLLVETMKIDLHLGVEYLHQRSHDADTTDGVVWEEDPKSPLGQQLIRIHASDAFRPLAEKHFCHGKKLFFVNCCKGFVGKPPDNFLLEQIRSQTNEDPQYHC